jgi:hypothetical protein
MEQIKEPTIAAAMNEVMALSQQADKMGRQDFEPDAFRDIARRLSLKTITPLEAIEQAQRLLDSKQMG